MTDKRSLLFFEGLKSKYPQYAVQELLDVKRPGKGTALEYEQFFDFESKDVNRALEFDLAFPKEGNGYVTLILSFNNVEVTRLRFSTINTKQSVYLPFEKRGLVKIQFVTKWIPFCVKSITETEGSFETIRASESDIECLSSTLSSIFEKPVGSLPIQVIEKNEVIEYSILMKSMGIDAAITRLLFQEQLEGFNNSPIVDLSYKHRFLEDGIVKIISPINPSKKLTAIASVPISSRVSSIVYEFYDSEPILVFTDLCFAGTVGFVYFPLRNIIIFDSSYWSSSWVSIKSALELYRDAINREPARLLAYRKREKELALISKTTGNMGHFFWNELPGLISAIENASDNAPIRVLELSNSWVSLNDYIPSFSSKLEAISHKELLDVTLHDNLILMRPTSSQVSNETAQYLQERNDLVIKSKYPQTYQQLDTITTNDFVLFINLRAHNKTWTRQIEGVTKLIERIQKLSNKNMIVYFDGWVDCEEIVNSITENLSNSITVVNGLDVPMDVTLSWAYKCNFFLAVIGSGLVPLTWLANKPGICISNLRHLKQLDDFWYLVRDNMRGIYAPEPEQIEDLENTMYSNFDISDDWIDRSLRDFFEVATEV